jgi:hypothetical protein
MTEQATTPVAPGADASVPAPLPDDRNPAIVDARKTFIITIVSAALFIGAVFIFII